MVMHAPGTKVTVRDRPLWGVGTVLASAPYMGLDGRHWCRVLFGEWKVHCESKELEVLP